ncbi:MAG TPA: OmpH family outer membrane protein [Gemmataceae bacterium]|nr:OmpH family outer membrane protein [Gemmataceae bacterium]
MKKAVLAAGIVLALGVLWYVSPLSGQTPPAGNTQAAATPAAPLRTRIAILNLTYVIKNYEKYKHFQEEIKGIVEPFQKKDVELRQKLENLRKEAGNVPRGQSAQGEELEKQARDIQRQLEDNGAEIKLKLGKRSDDEMKIVYMDVIEAAQRYAASHDFDLVLHYNDAVTEQDYVSAQNIARKLNTGALMPLYFQRNMDISMDVVKMLNYNLSATSAPGTPGTQPVNGQH